MNTHYGVRTDQFRERARLSRDDQPRSRPCTAPPARSSTGARLTALAGDPQALVAELDRLLMHGTMSPAARDAIVTAVNAVAAGDALGRAQGGLLSRRDVAAVSSGALTMNRRDFLRRTAALSAAGLAVNLDLLSLTAQRGGERLQGAGLRLPVRRRRRQQHPRADGHARATAHTLPSAARTRASSSRKPSCCRSRRSPPTRDTPFGLHPSHCRKSRRCSTPGSSRCSRTSGVADAADHEGAIRRRKCVRTISISHSDQQGEWQTASRLRRFAHRLGRAPRRCDRRRQRRQSFPVITSTAGRHAVM